MGRRPQSPKNLRADIRQQQTVLVALRHVLKTEQNIGKRKATEILIAEAMKELDELNKQPK